MIWQNFSAWNSTETFDWLNDVAFADFRVKKNRIAKIVNRQIDRLFSLSLFLYLTMSKGKANKRAKKETHKN